MDDNLTQELDEGFVAEIDEATDRLILRQGNAVVVFDHPVQWIAFIDFLTENKDAVFTGFGGIDL